MNELNVIDQEQARGLFLECIEKALEEERKLTAQAKARAFSKGGIPRLKTTVSEYLDTQAGKDGAAAFVLEEWPRITRGTSRLAPRMARAVEGIALSAYARMYMILAVESKQQDQKKKKR